MARKTPRTARDIWRNIDEQRPRNIGIRDWKRSYDGVKAALFFVGLVLHMTEKELENIPIPKDKNGVPDYGARAVIVSKNGVISKPTRIHNLLNGTSGLLTDGEREAIKDNVREKMKTIQPKGACTANTCESDTIDELDEIISTGEILKRQHLYECRLGDIAYGELSERDEWVGEQVKTSCENMNGQLNFKYNDDAIKVKGMLHYLKAGLSLKFIGKTRDGKISVVWYFYGQEAITMLEQFEDTQTFAPRLYLKVNKFHPFTTAYNDSKFRFDIELSDEEKFRLLIKMVDVVTNGKKYSLEYLNEDDSQIPNQNVRTEHKSYVMTRTACRSVGVEVSREHGNSHGSVDFLVMKAKIQDKVTTKDKFNLRPVNRHPINPDDFDILQISDIANNVIHAVPARKIDEEGIVASMFSFKHLMANTVAFGPQWKEQYADHKYDFNVKNDIVKYVEICNTASSIPKLTDASWYKNNVQLNKDKIGVNVRYRRNKNDLSTKI